MTSAKSMTEIVANRRIIVSVGTGGVGKTTMAAAIAIEAARCGRRALVITIDPARRLAGALGIGPLGNEPRAISPDVLASLAVPPRGQLYAMMLDMKRTFDDLVGRFANSEESRDRILANPIYNHVSDALAGSAEYSAMEKVYELCADDRFDLIVVDTPPSQHAVDFLDAPQRLLEFLDSRLVHMLVHPAFAAGRLGFRVFHRATERILRLIERVLGVAFLQEISDFLLVFEEMSEGFRLRAQSVRTLLTGPEAAFVLTSGTTAYAVGDAVQFLERLESFGVDIAAVVSNRVRMWPPGGDPPPRIPCEGQEGDALRSLGAALAGTARREFDPDAAARAAIDAAARYAESVRFDRCRAEPLTERARQRNFVWRPVPELPHDIHDLEGLGRIADALFERETGGGA